MILSPTFPYTNECMSGVLQYMKKKNLIKEKTFSYSSVFNKDYLPTNVLTLDDNYFNTLTNTSDNANFLIINLSKLFLFPKGYIIKSDPRNESAYLRSWKLYGSMNENVWEEIHDVFEQDDLRGGDIKRYPLNNGPYNLFKIVQTGPCLGPNDDHLYRLRIFYIDFFGYMINFWKKERTCKAKLRSLPLSKLLLILIVR